VLRGRPKRARAGQRNSSRDSEYLYPESRNGDELTLKQLMTPIREHQHHQQPQRQREGSPSPGEDDGAAAALGRDGSGGSVKKRRGRPLRARASGGDGATVAVGGMEVDATDALMALANAVASESGGEQQSGGASGAASPDVAKRRWGDPTESSGSEAEAVGEESRGEGGNRKRSRVTNAQEEGSADEMMEVDGDTSGSPEFTLPPSSRGSSGQLLQQRPRRRSSQHHQQQQQQQQQQQMTAGRHRQAAAGSGHHHRGAAAAGSDSADGGEGAAGGGAVGLQQQLLLLPLLPDVELTSPEAKSVAFNGVLSLLKVLHSDSATCVHVFKALNRQLASPAPQFLGTPYQYLQACCLEQDVSALKAAIDELAASGAD